ncbi:hypothetical protein RMSM_03153 [Rhodopirellula maiorica SM1]|uniref:Uncharacterized protein n=1 Tax=Rhodopirellula maiorica SM1 TaxID=1265738 RepID=M5RKR9_9BACT|nr:hypothetical protein [Rhodopirellula maiorica]EMI19905.1 hypothetical protein RMSM_03153 [Rhodopirellula maiorica SM1]
MTWRTSEGDRILEGAEAELVRESLGCMIDRLQSRVSDPANLEGDWRWDFDVPLFDQLTTSEQLAVLHEIAEYLLTPTAKTLAPSAVNDAGVYAIFQTARQFIEDEIDQQRQGLGEGELDPDDWYSELEPSMRVLTLRAYDECFRDDDFGNEGDFGDVDSFRDEDLVDAGLGFSCGDMPAADGQDMTQWCELIESLADQILSDRDFEMADEMLDLDPALANAMKQSLGIRADYYSDVAADLRAEQIEETLTAIRKITHPKPR